MLKNFISLLLPPRGNQLLSQPLLLLIGAVTRLVFKPGELQLQPRNLLLLRRRQRRIFLPSLLAILSSQEGLLPLLLQGVYQQKCF
jgi:hypothetical protein